MTWPTVAIDTTDLDAGTDSPASARADLKDAVDKLNQIMAHVSTFIATLLDDATAADARTTLGAAVAGLVASSGLTIAQDRVAGRVSSGTGALEPLTGAQIAALLSAASESAQGAVELATTAEFLTGTDPARVPSVAALRAGLIAMQTAVSASGTTLDYTGIPSWANEVVLHFAGVSSNSSGHIAIQIGSGSLVTSGYSALSVASAATNTVVSVSGTAAFYIYTGSAGDTFTGDMVLRRINGNTWVSTHVGNRSGWGTVGGGMLALGGALDRLRFINTTGDFDGGTVNVSWR